MADLFHQVEPEAPPGVYVEVAVERGIERAGQAGGGTLTYRAETELEIGQCVRVPLGRSNKPTQGVVVRAGGAELVRGMPAHKVKSILKVTGTRLPARLVELAQWMAGYYICPLGMVLATMVPAAVKRGVGLRKKVYLNRVARLSEPETESDGAEPEDPARRAGLPALSPAARAVWAAIERISAADFPLTPADLQERTGAKNKGPINRLIEAGLLVKIEREELASPFSAWEALRIEQEESAHSEGGTPTEPGGMPTPSSARACERAGRGQALPLTEAQRRIVEGIAPTLGSFRAHLLRGVTGSGKTEVYLQLIERVVRPVEEGGRGQCALVLVPEIALTPQTAGRFTQRFGGPGGPGVAVLHSGLTASQRHKQWEAAATGRAKVIVGARSAIFAPVTDVGLIVVDEEHDDSGYKQDQSPRYHGRDVAVKRAHLEGCPIVLGSATPSLESWHNARAGRYSLWELSERVPGAGVLPKVEIVDLAHERRARQQRALQAAREAGNRPIRDTALHLLGPTLEEALRDTIHAGGQAILLLNRRGFAHYITCPAAACGWVMNCDDCDATMVLHKGLEVHHRGNGEQHHRYVRCHHCLAEQLMPDECPVCGRRVNVFGGGTQRVEEELLRKFEIDLGLVQGETFARVDSDTMRSARDWFDILSRFARGELRLLVGTQMIAKGLDFPNVRLVGVVNADTALTMPDFRSAERTFQLVSQVAGRAGRGRHPGRVIVQTLSPHAPAIRLAAVHDYVTFADGELTIRATSAGGGLPPITKMARIVVRDEEYSKAEQDAGRIASILRKELEDEAKRREATTGRRPRFRIEGPAPCPISRIANRHRIALDIYAEDRTIIQQALGAARAAGHLISDAHTAVDVDPTALL